ncbi:MAG: rod shape-determining protein RodA [Lachnospiraceae bacterium]|jgi:rod shape determining protein RodA|nr:rod shape-determining protein RodA [Lachnospiraceae bacterium]
MLFNYKIRNFNFRLVIYVLVLSGIGVLIIRSASGSAEDTRVMRQIIGICAGLFIALALSLIDYHRLMNLSTIIYLICTGMLAWVLLNGVMRGGATRWIVLPVLGQLQPSEFTKIGLIIFFSWYFDKYQERINQFSILAAAAVLFGIPVLLILAEPNLSTSLIMIMMFTAMIFAAGLSYRWIFSILAVLTPVVAIFIYLLQYEMVPFLKDYQARRILSFINPVKYQENNLQQDNSVMAIGSGQLWGKGLNNTTIASVKNGNFLSEESTDFIFAVIGEELGFVGSMVVLGLFLLIIYECLLMARRAKDAGGKLLCTGMAALIGFQSFSNIAVATKLFPNTGLPLPFISYGVSSLLSIYLGIGIILNVGLQRKNTHN